MGRTGRTSWWMSSVVLWGRWGPLLTFPSTMGVLPMESDELEHQKNELDLKMQHEEKKYQLEMKRRHIEHQLHNRKKHAKAKAQEDGENEKKKDGENEEIKKKEGGVDENQKLLQNLNNKAKKQAVNDKKAQKHVVNDEEPRKQKGDQNGKNEKNVEEKTDSDGTNDSEEKTTEESDSDKMDYSHSKKDSDQKHGKSYNIDKNNLKNHQTENNQEDESDDKDVVEFAQNNHESLKGEKNNHEFYVGKTSSTKSSNLYEEDDSNDDDSNNDDSTNDDSTNDDSTNDYFSNYGYNKGMSNGNAEYKRHADSILEEAHWKDKRMFMLGSIGLNKDFYYDELESLKISPFKPNKSDSNAYNFGIVSGAFSIIGNLFSTAQENPKHHHGGGNAEFNDGLSSGGDDEPGGINGIGNDPNTPKSKGSLTKLAENVEQTTGPDTLEIKTGVVLTQSHVGGRYHSPEQEEHIRDACFEIRQKVKAKLEKKRREIQQAEEVAKVARKAERKAQKKVAKKTAKEATNMKVEREKNADLTKKNGKNASNRNGKTKKAKAEDSDGDSDENDDSDEDSNEDSNDNEDSNEDSNDNEDSNEDSNDNEDSDEDSNDKDFLTVDEVITQLCRKGETIQEQYCNRLMWQIQIKEEVRRHHQERNTARQKVHKNIKKYDKAAKKQAARKLLGKKIDRSIDTSNATMSNNVTDSKKKSNLETIPLECHHDDLFVVDQGKQEKCTLQKDLDQLDKYHPSELNGKGEHNALNLSSLSSETITCLMTLKAGMNYTTDRYATDRYYANKFIEEPNHVENHKDPNALPNLSQINFRELGKSLSNSPKSSKKGKQLETQMASGTVADLQMKYFVSISIHDDIAHAICQKADDNPDICSDNALKKPVILQIDTGSTATWFIGNLHEKDPNTAIPLYKTGWEPYQVCLLESMQIPDLDPKGRNSSASSMRYKQGYPVINGLQRKGANLWNHFQKRSKMKQNTTVAEALKLAREHCTNSVALRKYLYQHRLCTLERIEQGCQGMERTAHSPQTELITYRDWAGATLVSGNTQTDDNNSTAFDNVGNIEINDGLETSNNHGTTIVDELPLIVQEYGRGRVATFPRSARKASLAGIEIDDFSHEVAFLIDEVMNGLIFDGILGLDLKGISFFDNSPLRIAAQFRKNHHSKRKNHHPNRNTKLYDYGSSIETKIKGGGDSFNPFNSEEDFSNPFEVRRGMTFIQRLRLNPPFNDLANPGAFYAELKDIDIEQYIAKFTNRQKLRLLDRDDHNNDSSHDDNNDSSDDQNKDNNSTQGDSSVQSVQSLVGGSSHVDPSLPDKIKESPTGRFFIGPLKELLEKESWYGQAKISLANAAHSAASYVGLSSSGVWRNTRVEGEGTLEEGLKLSTDSLTILCKGFDPIPIEEYQKDPFVCKQKQLDAEYIIPYGVLPLIVTVTERHKKTKEKKPTSNNGISHEMNDDEMNHEILKTQLEVAEGRWAISLSKYGGKWQIVDPADEFYHTEGTKGVFSNIMDTTAVMSPLTGMPEEIDDGTSGVSDERLQEVIARSPVFHAARNTQIMFDTGCTCSLFPDKVYTRYRDIVLENYTIWITSSYSGLSSARRQQKRIQEIKESLDLNSICQHVNEMGQRHKDMNPHEVFPKFRISISGKVFTFTFKEICVKGEVFCIGNLDTNGLLTFGWILGDNFMRKYRTFFGFTEPTIFVEMPRQEMFESGWKPRQEGWSYLFGETNNIADDTSTSTTNNDKNTNTSTSTSNGDKIAAHYYNVIATEETIWGYGKRGLINPKNILDPVTPSLDSIPLIHPPYTSLFPNEFPNEESQYIKNIKDKMSDASDLSGFYRIKKASQILEKKSKNLFIITIITLGSIIMVLISIFVLIYIFGRNSKKQEKKNDNSGKTNIAEKVERFSATVKDVTTEVVTRISTGLNDLSRDLSYQNTTKDQTSLQGSFQKSFQKSLQRSLEGKHDSDIESQASRESDFNVKKQCVSSNTDTRKRKGDKTDDIVSFLESDEEVQISMDQSGVAEGAKTVDLLRLGESLKSEKVFDKTLIASTPVKSGATGNAGAELPKIARGLTGLSEVGGVAELFSPKPPEEHRHSAGMHNPGEDTTDHRHSAGMHYPGGNGTDHSAGMHYPGEDGTSYGNGYQGMAFNSDPNQVGFAINTSSSKGKGNVGLLDTSFFDAIPNPFGQNPFANTQNPSAKSQKSTFVNTTFDGGDLLSNSFNDAVVNVSDNVNDVVVTARKSASNAANMIRDFFDLHGKSSSLAHTEARSSVVQSHSVQVRKGKMNENDQKGTSNGMVDDGAHTASKATSGYDKRIIGYDDMDLEVEVDHYNGDEYHYNGDEYHYNGDEWDEDAYDDYGDEYDDVDGYNDGHNDGQTWDNESDYQYYNAENDKQHYDVENDYQYYNVENYGDFSHCNSAAQHDPRDNSYDDHHWENDGQGYDRDENADAAWDHANCTADAASDDERQHYYNTSFDNDYHDGNYNVNYNEYVTGDNGNATCERQCSNTNVDTMLIESRDRVRGQHSKGVKR